MGSGRCCPFGESRLVSEWMDTFEARALERRIEGETSIELMVEEKRQEEV